LTQVSTGHPHEGSSYPAQKVLQCGWHRLEHTKSRLNELDKLRQVGLTPAQKHQLIAAQQASKQQQQQQQQQQVIRNQSILLTFKVIAICKIVTIIKTYSDEIINMVFVE
jgi:hypothetical protein